MLLLQGVAAGNGAADVGRDHVQVHTQGVLRGEQQQQQEEEEGEAR